MLSLRPDWTRTVAARRAAAGALVLLAAVAALRPDPSDGAVAVLIATRDLSPGVTLTADDVRLESRSATTIPDGAQTNAGEVEGLMVAGPTRRGEVLTDVRLLTPRLTDAAVGPDARVVAINLADAALLDLLRPGDVVDVLAANSVAPGVDSVDTPRVIASDAVVVMVSQPAQSPTAGDQRVVLVALPARAATEVAGASLVQAVTLTMR